MQLFQALWTESEQLFVFCESSERYRNFDEQAVDRAVHPFVIESEELALFFRSREIESYTASQLSLSLPTLDGKPLVSPLLIPGDHHSGNLASVPLRPWIVSGLLFSPDQAIDALFALFEQSSDPCHCDGAAKYYFELFKFTLELLSRGRYIPQLRHENNSFSSRWQAVVSSPEDKTRLELFKQSIPGICTLGIGLGTYQSTALIFSFLSALGDALIRRFLARHELLPTTLEPGVVAKLRAAISWVVSLTKSSPAVEDSAVALLNLETRLRHWAQPVLPSVEQFTLRTSFELISPPLGSTSDEPWRLTFGLEDAVSRRRISARQLWRGQLDFLERSELSRSELEEMLLRDLSRACQSFPAMRRALHSSFPEELSLSVTEAYEFLRSISKLLEQSSLGITLPAWWTERKDRVGLQLNVRARDKDIGHQNLPSNLGMSDLLQFSWEVHIGDQQISMEEFSQLAQSSAPLVRVKDTWIELNPAQIERTFQFIKHQKENPELTALDAFRLGLGLNVPDGALPVVGFSASGWMERMMHLSPDRLHDVPQPESFRGELRSYQHEGLSWLAFLSALDIGACLADDMGLGKTIQFLALLAHEKEIPSATQLPNLLVVPMSILNNWVEEAERFTPHLKVYVHHGSDRCAGEAFLNHALPADIVITTYSLLHRDEKLFQDIRWKRITLDEAQNIKNLETKQTQAVRRLIQRLLSQDPFGKSCHRLALTGTPLENNLEELWSIFDFLNPGLLGTLQDFRQRFSLPIERYRDAERAQTLATAIQPFILRRLKSDPRIAKDLPEKIEMEVFAPMTAEQGQLYQHVLDTMLEQVDHSQGIHRKGLVLATITKLKQICNHPSLVLKDGRQKREISFDKRSGKIQCLVDLLEVILAEGDKVLIFSQFAQFGALLKPFLEERFSQEVLFLHGGLPRRQRDDVITRFQQPKGPSIFLLSLKAGGFGLNLTEANQVIHLDQWWNPAVIQQATDRAHRIGQKRNVQVRKFICKGTLEERIAKLLELKQGLADQVVSATRSVVTQMSTDELRDLLKLSAQSIEEQV